MDSNVYNPSIPYIGPLSGQLQPGNLIRVSGVVKSSATCFAINLQTGDNTFQRSDIALHLSPVFSSPPRLVRNSLEKQNWGPEESHGPYLPLVAGQSFEILILAGAEDFKVAINGQHFTEFQHRLPLQSISHIAIDGEVTINHIKFEGLTKSSMASGSGEGISKPLGFVIDPSNSGNTMASPSGGRAPSPYGSSNLPYPPSPSFGPSPTPYAPPSDTGYAPNALSPNSPYAPYNPYGPQQSGRISPNPYGPQQSGRVSPNPYGPQQSGRVSPNPYGLPPAGNPYGPPPGNPYPQGYPQQQGPYPSQGYPGSYPSQPSPYPGTHVEYPGQQKKSEGSGGMNLGPLAAAGAAALAGVAGSSLLGGKKHKKKKHGHGISGMLGHGTGPAALIGGMSSLLGGNKHGGVPDIVTPSPSYKKDVTIRPTDKNKGEKPRKKERSPNTWKRALAKEKRYAPKGTPTLSTCNHKKGSLLCQSLTAQDIKRFNSVFYKEHDKIYQDNFILKHVTINKIKQRRPKNQRYVQKEARAKYFISTVEKKLVPVCFNTFQSVLKVSRFRVNRIVERFYQESEMPRERRGGDTTGDRFLAKKANFINFINSLKCSETLYRTNKSGRKYLPAELNIKKLWLMYQSTADDDLKVKESYFRQMFNRLYNLGFGTPRKDVGSTGLDLTDKAKSKTKLSVSTADKNKVETAKKKGQSPNPWKRAQAKEKSITRVAVPFP